MRGRGGGGGGGGGVKAVTHRIGTQREREPSLFTTAHRSDYPKSAYVQYMAQYSQPR